MPHSQVSKIEENGLTIVHPYQIGKNPKNFSHDLESQLLEKLQGLSSSVEDAKVIRLCSNNAPCEEDVLSFIRGFYLEKRFVIENMDMHSFTVTKSNAHYEIRTDIRNSALTIYIFDYSNIYDIRASEPTNI